MVHREKQVLSGSDSSCTKIGQRNCSPAASDSSPQAVKETQGGLVQIQATYFHLSSICCCESQPNCTNFSGVSEVVSKGFGPDTSQSESDSAFPRKSLGSKSWSGLS